MAHNAPEYRTIVQCTAELVIALKDDLTTISGELSAASLITCENVTALTNQANDVSHRANQLVGFIRNKVSLETKNYHSFVQVLKDREDDHKDILKILCKKYKELECHTPSDTKPTRIKKCTSEFVSRSLGKRHADQSPEATCSSPKKPKLTSSGRENDLLFVSEMERRFIAIREQFIGDLIAQKQLMLTDIRSSLVVLPMKLRGYSDAIKNRRKALSTVTDKTELFYHLNSLFSFIDIKLLKHCINKWGSDPLKERMKCYEKELETFRENTTVRQLIDYLPGQQEPPKGYMELIAAHPDVSINWTLSEIENQRHRRCAQVQLSEILFCLIGMEQIEDLSINVDMPVSFNPEHEINEFDKRRDDLHKRIHFELDQRVKPAHLLQALTMLPLRLRKQSGEQVYKELPMLQQQEDICEIFDTLGHLFFKTFIDYYLFEFVVLKYSSKDLRESMQSYDNDVQNFMRRTTVKQLCKSSCWQVIALKCDLKLPESVRRKLDNSHPELTLKQLDILQQRCGTSAGLSTLVDYVVLVHHDELSS